MSTAIVLAVLTALLASHCALGLYSPTAVFVSKNPGLRSQGFTSHPWGEGSFTPITGENAAPGEISFFTGYSGPNEVEDIKLWIFTRYCNFHKALHIFRRGSSWLITSSSNVSGFKREFTVYVAESICVLVPTVKVYYAHCEEHGDAFGRVGTTRGLCGSFKTLSEGSFYATDAGLTCRWLPEIHGGRYIPTWDGAGISSYKYQCDTGYKLQGKQIIHCQSDGRWSGQPPRCED